MCKQLNQIVIPYVNKEREKMGNLDQYALLIWDVFRGQKTNEVTSLLQENKIFNEYVPNNMTSDFQVLDLTVNKWVKDFMKSKFNEWFAAQLRTELENGVDFANITTMKPLHAGWLISFYDKLTSLQGSQVLLSGWRAAGIVEAL